MSFLTILCVFMKENTIIFSLWLKIILKALQSQFRVIGNLVEGTLWLIIQVMNEDIEQDWTQYWPWGCTIHYWTPTRLCAADHHHHGPRCSASFQPISLSTRPPEVFMQLRKLQVITILSLGHSKVSNSACLPITLNKPAQIFASHKKFQM